MSVAIVFTFSHFHIDDITVCIARLNIGAGEDKNFITFAALDFIFCLTEFVVASVYAFPTITSAPAAMFRKRSGYSPVLRFRLLKIIVNFYAAIRASFIICHWYLPFACLCAKPLSNYAYSIASVCFFRVILIPIACKIKREVYNFLYTSL